MNDFGMDMQSICKLNNGEMGMIVHIDICKKNNEPQLSLCFLQTSVHMSCARNLAMPMECNLLGSPPPKDVTIAWEQ